MGTEKLLGKLQKYLKHGEKSDAAARCEQIDDILDKLEKKERKLKKKLNSEKDKGKRKKLDMELRIVSLQRKKGIKRRKDLAAKCK